MTKTEAFDEIRKICSERARKWFSDANRRDLDRYDRIAGIVRRVDEDGPAEKRPPKP